MARCARLYVSKWFQRWARKESISPEELSRLADEVEAGRLDADLGGGVLKQRLARAGKGKSGGFRTILLFRRGIRIVFVYGFSKSDQDNIDSSELRAFRDAAIHILELSSAQMDRLVEDGAFVEILRNEQQQIPQ